MKTVKEFFKENKIFIIAGISIVILCIGIYYYTARARKIVYDKGEDKDIEYIERKYAANEYSPVTIELIDLLQEYYLYYIRLQVNNPDEAYDMLTDECKSRFNNDIKEYKNYIKQINTILTLDNKVEKYRVDKYNNQIIEIVDSEQNKYTIYEYGVWDIKISIDGKE